MLATAGEKNGVQNEEMKPLFIVVVGLDRAVVFHRDLHRNSVFDRVSDLEAAEPMSPVSACDAIPSFLREGIEMSVVARS